jgi:hypothetical protein
MEIRSLLDQLLSPVLQMSTWGILNAYSSLPVLENAAVTLFVGLQLSGLEDVERM